MLTRRRFAACALCCVTGFVATEAEAQNALGGPKRTIINARTGRWTAMRPATMSASISTRGTLILATLIRGIEFEL